MISDGKRSVSVKQMSMAVGTSEIRLSLLIRLSRVILWFTFFGGGYTDSLLILVQEDQQVRGGELFWFAPGQIGRCADVRDRDDVSEDGPDCFSLLRWRIGEYTEDFRQKAIQLRLEQQRKLSILC